VYVVLRVHWALFVQDFLKLCVIILRLLTSRIALNRHDFLVWLALSGVSRVVPLDLIEVAFAVALLVAVALGEAVVLFILLVTHRAIMSHSSTAVVGRRLKS
jgi:hypothetical protein